MIYIKENRFAEGNGGLSCDLVIVNYNAGVLLDKCVSSAFIAGAHKIIIVDNASIDNSLKNLKSSDNNKLSILYNSYNMGFAAACNIGYAQTTQHVLFLNPDCQLAPDTLIKLLKVLQSSPKIGMVGGLLTHPDGTEQQGGRRAIPTPWRSLVRAFGLYRLAKYWPNLFFDFHLHQQPLPSQPIKVEAISGACMLVKREAVEEVGLWDDAYFLHCEDLDWCMRFRQKGWDIMFVPDAKVKHAQGACSKNRQIFVEWHKHKGMMRFYHKFFKQHDPKPLWLLVTIGVWLRFSLVSCYLIGQRFLLSFKNRSIK